MIDSKVFRSIIHQYLLDYGFNKKGENYILNFPELKIVIGLQKSEYSHGFYINLGYIFTEIGLGNDLPRAVDGDIRTRFSVEIEGKDNDLFDLERLSNDILLGSLQMNIENYVSGIVDLKMIKNLLVKNPVLLHQTTINAKKKLDLSN